MPIQYFPRVPGDLHRGRFTCLPIVYDLAERVVKKLLDVEGDLPVKQGGQEEVEHCGEVGLLGGVPDTAFDDLVEDVGAVLPGGEGGGG